MTGLISPALLMQISQFVNSQMGLHFPQKRWPDLARGLARAAGDFGFDDAEACVQWLLSAPLTQTQIETLADHLTIGETYFFRERNALEALQNYILPALIKARGQASLPQLKIWSAGCCTGEEPYSIAILLDKNFPELANWQVSILASDINPRFLQQAKKGCYRDWSFRATPAWVKDQYFIQRGQGEVQIAERIKKRVTFFPLNLIEDTYPSFLNETVNLDVILCRNVLIYFDQHSIDRVVKRFYRALAEGGWLIVGSTEFSTQYYSQFTPVQHAGFTIYQKVAQPGNFVDRPAKETVPVPPRLAPPPPAAITEKLYGQALQLFQQGRYAETVSALKPNLAADGQNNKTAPPVQSEAFLLLVKAYANQGRLAEARHWAEKAIAADKLNPGCYYLLGTILQEQGEFDEASRAFKRVLFLEPDFILAMVALGNMARRQGKNREANRYFNNSLLVLRNLAPDSVLFGSENITAAEVINNIRAMLE
ncbi:MAG: hypothetical protein FOGNACKC_04078 [Anaerolineae bacterium]|nr:hypothetical protein [Anaerolineae bacterium]